MEKSKLEKINEGLKESLLDLEEKLELLRGMKRYVEV